MGKTSKPLYLIVDDSLLAHDAVFSDLRSHGHRVDALSSATGEDLAACDLILSPKAWRMLPGLLKYLPAALKGARLET